MDLYEAIEKRRTIRRFRQEDVPPAVLEKLVNAARLAPSGGNLQPWAFIVVRRPDLRDAVFEALSWAAYLAPEGAPPEGRRPRAYIVVLQNTGIKKLSPSPDIAAAIENILLAATAEGLGGCWLGAVRREHVAAILSVPGSYLVDSVVALGYPDETSSIEKYEDTPRYWKDDDGRMHVPKRALKDVLHHETFEPRPGA